MGRLLIENGVIVNDGVSRRGYVVIEGERIAKVAEGEYKEDERGRFSERIDARGGYILPGVIDCHVHFREPGLTQKGDIHSESIAAISGGVTSYFEMPNTNPPTTSVERLEEKRELARRGSVANFSFFIGATNQNIKEILRVDPKRTCGVKVFVGSSTGDMLVDDPMGLAAIFAESGLPIAVHCEDERIIRENLSKYRAEYGDGVPIGAHPEIRSEEACYRSTAQTIELAERYGTQLHVTHLTTARELTLFDDRPAPQKRITAEVCLNHLLFSQEDYERLGNQIKCNPAIKLHSDMVALREALSGNRVDVVATDHAPHTWEEKMGSYLSAPSGVPMVGHSLVAMLGLVEQGVLSVEQLVGKMCHRPAEIFGVEGRGFLREGAYADVVVVREEEWVVERKGLLYKCGWSPLEGQKMSHRVEYTIVNGAVVNRLGVIDRDYRAKEIEFKR